MPEHRTRSSSAYLSSFPRRRESIGFRRARMSEHRTRQSSACLPPLRGACHRDGGAPEFIGLDRSRKPGIAGRRLAVVPDQTGPTPGPNHCKQPKETEDGSQHTDCGNDRVGRGARSQARHGGGRGGGAALVDLRRRGRRAQRAEGGPGIEGRHLAGHAGRRRGRHRGDDRAPRPGDRGQRTDRGPDARLRHPRLGEGRRARQPERGGVRGRLGCRRPHRAAGIRQARRQLDLRPGERPLHQLGVDQQGRARRRRRQGAGGPGRSSSPSSTR